MRIHLNFPGDSVCSALLHSPNIDIKNPLLRGATKKAESNLDIIAEQLPRSFIQLSRIPGVENSCDLALNS